MLSKIVYGIDACNVVHSLTFIHESGKPWASQVLTAIWMKSIWMNLLQSCLELAESFFISCSAFTASQIKLVISVVSTQSLPSHNVISNVCPYLRIINYNANTKSKLQISIRASSTVYDVLHCIFFIFDKNIIKVLFAFVHEFNTNGIKLFFSLVYLVTEHWCLVFMHNNILIYTHKYKLHLVCASHKTSNMKSVLFDPKCSFFSGFRAFWMNTDVSSI